MNATQVITAPAAEATPAAQPTLSELIADLRRAAKAHGQAHEACTAAQDAAAAIWRDQPDWDGYAKFPVPPELQVPEPGRYVVSLVMTYSDGSEIVNTVDRPPVVDLNTREKIIKHCEGDEARAAPLLKALATWQKDRSRRFSSPQPPAEAVESQALLRAARERRMVCMDALENAAEALLAAPVATAADMLAKAKAFVSAWGGKVRKSGHTGIDENLAEQLLASLLRDLSGAARPTFVWDKAMAAFTAARQAALALDDEIDAVAGLVSRDAPEPPELVSFIDEDHIVRSPSLSFDEKTELVGKLRQFRSAQAEAKARHGMDALTVKLNEADETLASAREALMAIEPPTLAALAFKFREVMTDGVLLCHPDELPERMSEKLSSMDDDIGVVRLYQDVLKMAGVDDPAIGVEPFDAKAWIVNFERWSGHQVTDLGAHFFDVENATYSAACPAYLATGQAVWGDLRKWKRQLVKAAARERADKLRIAGISGSCWDPALFCDVVRAHGGLVYERDGDLWFGQFCQGSSDDFILSPLRFAVETNPERKAAVLDYLSRPDMRLSDAGRRGPGRGDPDLEAQLENAGAFTPRAEVGMAAE